MNEFTRRRLLSTSAAALATGVAGCNTTNSSADASTLTDNDDDGVAQAASTDANTTELQQRIAELENENENLRNQLSEKNETVSTLRTELDREKQRVEGLKERSQSPNETIARLEADLEAREKRIEELKELVDTEFSDETIAQAKALTEEIADAVIFFSIDYGGGASGTGTGWFIDENHIVTNAHVINPYYSGDAVSMKAYLRDGTEISHSLVGKQLGWNEPERVHMDLAIIKTNATAPKVLPLSDRAPPENGTPVLQVGHPGMIGNWVGSLGHCVDSRSNDGLVEMEIPSKSGNSGSPVVTLDGRVIACTYGSTMEGSVMNSDGSPKLTDVSFYTEYPYQQKMTAEGQSANIIQKYYDDWV